MRRLGELLPSNWDLQAVWLKLDIEGAEFDVLKDMVETRQFPGAISVELHDVLPGAKGDLFMSTLRDNGYKVSVKGGGTQGKVDLQFLAVRKAENVSEAARPVT